jgi:hypothetical protein
LGLGDISRVITLVPSRSVGPQSTGRGSCPKLLRSRQQGPGTQHLRIPVSLECVLWRPSILDAPERRGRLAGLPSSPRGCTIAMRRWRMRLDCGVVRYRALGRKRRPQPANASVAFATVTANLAHRGARIDRTSQTGTALPAWEPIWKCLASLGACAQGFVTGPLASRRPVAVRSERGAPMADAVRLRCGAILFPLTMHSFPFNHAAHPHSSRQQPSVTLLSVLLRSPAIVQTRWVAALYHVTRMTANSYCTVGTLTLPHLVLSNRSVGCALSKIEDEFQLFPTPSMPNAHIHPHRPALPLLPFTRSTLFARDQILAMMGFF